MTQANLSTVTLQTVANYRHAAERAVGAYRSGGHRLIAVVQQGVDQAAKRGAEPYVPAFAAVLRRAGDNMGSFAVHGVDAVSDGTERVIKLGSNGVSAQVKRAAHLAGGVDNRLVAKGLKAAARISLPTAQVALALSERVAAGADKLATVAAGPRKAKAKSKVTAKTKANAQRAHRVAAKPAGRVLRKAVRDTTTEVKATADTVKIAARRRAKVAAAKVEKVVASARPKVAAKPVRRAVRKAAPVARTEAAAAAA